MQQAAFLNRLIGCLGGRFDSGLLLLLHLLQHGAYAGKICAVFQKFLFHVFLRSGKGRQNAALFLIICGIKLLW